MGATDVGKVVRVRRNSEIMSLYASFGDDIELWPSLVYCIH